MGSKTRLALKASGLSAARLHPLRAVRYAASTLRWHRFFPVVSLILFVSCSGGCSEPQPPALTGITIVAVGDDGKVDSRFVARTSLQPPVPVIGVQPGIPPKTGTFLWNQPKSGRIAITLVRGRQSFTFHTTEWTPHRQYVVALFLNRDSVPSFVVLTGKPNRFQAARPVGLDAELLPPQQPVTTVVRGDFEVTLERLSYPLAEPQLDLVGPWSLRPDNLADRLGVLTLYVRKRTVDSKRLAPQGHEYLPKDTPLHALAAILPFSL